MIDESCDKEKHKLMKSIIEEALYWIIIDAQEIVNAIKEDKSEDL